MPRFRATLRIEGLQGENAREVRDALVTKLGKIELSEARVMSIDEMRERQQKVERRAFVAPAPGAWRKQSNAAGLVLLGAIGLAMWVFWSLWASYSAGI